MARPEYIRRRRPTPEDVRQNRDEAPVQSNALQPLLWLLHLGWWDSICITMSQKLEQTANSKSL
jgi:hypothetical protein